MPCGPRARLTAYVAYQTLTFAERDVLLAALADAGFIRVETAPVGTETNNPLPLSDSTGRTVAGAALVVHRDDLPFGFGDLGFVMLDGAYVPILPSDARAEPILRNLRLPTAGPRLASSPSKLAAVTRAACSAPPPPMAA